MAAADLQQIIAQPAAFEALVATLLSADNQSRQQGEKLFEQLKQDADACVSHLLRVLRQSPNAEHRAFCAIMLRKVLCQGEPTRYQAASPQVQAAVRTELLAALGQEQERSVVKKACDTVSELASELIDSDGQNKWPELLPFLQQMISSQQAAAMDNALSILASLASYNLDALKPSLAGGLHTMITACLAPPCTLDVQMAAFRCVANFVSSMEEAKDREQFQPLLPAMLAVLGRTLQAGDEMAAQEAIELLIEVGDSHPKFLRKHLAEVVDAMLQVANVAHLEGATRGLAAEFLVTLGEARDKAPGMVRKLPDYVSRLFGALMGFLLDIEDDPLWHKGDSDAHEEEGHGELFDGGQEFLDRLAMAMGGKALVPAAGALLPTWLRDSDWRKRHATLVCLAQIAEGCTKEMMGQVETLVQMCLAGLSDPHPKVRWAACQALGQMCTDLGPDIQERCGQQILPALMAQMDDFNAPRVQAHASAAVVNFSENCEQDMMAPHLDALIGKLLALLQRGQRIVQEGALTAMASVADCAQDAFIKYYDHVMPPLSQILLGASDKQHRLLRAKALECISLVGMAVGKDRFRGDAQHVLSFMQQMQSQEMDPDDPTASYMLQAGARLCKCLGAEFLPYLAVVMPPLLRTAAQEPDIKVRTADDDDFDDDDDDDDVEHVPVGDKVLSIRTSSLEDKVTACNMLCCYADELKAGFFPYVQQVAQIMVPLLRFYFHEDVRRAAVQSLPQLLLASQQAAEAGAPGADVAFVKGLVDFFWEPLMTALHKEPDTDVQSSMLDSLVEVVEAVDAAQLSQAQVEAAFKQFDHVLVAAEQRRLHRQKRMQAEDFDEEEAEALEQENEAEEELFDNVGNGIGAFLKKYGDAALPYVELLMPKIAPLLDKSRSEEDRRIGLCIVDDMLEHSPAGRAKYAAQVLPVILDASLAAHADLRQCACYGLGVLAAKAPDMFRPHVQAALQKLLPILQHPEAHSDDNDMATDNAASAVGRILEHHGEAIDGVAVASAWVAALPLKADSVEAVGQHELLVRLLEGQDPRVLGAGNQHLPHLVKAMVTVLGRGSELVAPEVGLRMAALLQQLQAAVPADVAAGAVAGLSDKQRARFNDYMAGKAPST